MRIILIGAGEVGSYLAEVLSQEGHDVTVIEEDHENCQRIANLLDVLVIEGSGASSENLMRAGVKDTDIIIAVSAVDEINIVACMMAREFGVATKIARIRNLEYSSEGAVLPLEKIGIDLVIHPELEAAREILRLIKYSQATDVLEFAGGAVQMVGVKVTDDAPIKGMTMRETAATFPKLTFRTVAIKRNKKSLIPRGEDKFEAGDLVYVISTKECIPGVFSMAGRAEKESKNVMILGGGKIGRMVAQELEKEGGYLVKLIESNQEKSQLIAGMLKDTMVIHGDGLDVDLLAQEGIVDMDVYIALTDDDESNIVSSLMASHLRVPRTITLISKGEYLPIINTIGLDVAVNKRIITAGVILKYVRPGRIASIARVKGINAEIIEFDLTEKKGLVNVPLKDLHFPQGMIVGAILHNGVVAVPTGDDRMRGGDRAIVFALPEAVKKVEKIFQ
ncbi:Trk system potassium transporter TrkA [candidate division KSB1 bacterium]|nr:Trk system potassium transporter TrkA [candidate division KSB1 bacterium]